MRQLVSIMLGAAIATALCGCPTELKKIEQTAFETGPISFTMSALPALAFPKGPGDRKSVSIDSPIQIAQTEVTYELWRAVYDWAVDEKRGENRYDFANAGRQGGDGSLEGNPVGGVLHPVTVVSWRDCVVWLNALTEWWNEQTGARLTPVYYADSGCTSPLRDSRDHGFAEDTDMNPGSVDNPFRKPEADGSRLPTCDEWEFAARYIGDFDNDGRLAAEGEFYRYDHASGAQADFRNHDATGRVAWLAYNSGGATHPVAEKDPSALGLHDMNGNVFEWCWDTHDKVTDNRMYRGGSWGTEDWNSSVSVVSFLGAKPFFAVSSLGFRFARNNQ